MPAIVTACEAFIRDRLKPRFLPEIQPHPRFNYAVDLRGAWAAGRYRFIIRFRSGTETDPVEEFDAPFARIVRTGRDRFDIDWMRHTGQWWPLHQDVSLREALHILETDGVLFPHC